VLFENAAHAFGDAPLKFLKKNMRWRVPSGSLWWRRWTSPPRVNQSTDGDHQWETYADRERYARLRRRSA